MKKIKSDQNQVLDAIADIERFKTDKPTPPDPEKIKAGFNWIKSLREMEPFVMLLGKNPDRHKIGDQLADALDFKATILPNSDGCNVEAKVNPPLKPIQLEEESARVMVDTASRGRGYRG